MSPSKRTTGIPARVKAARVRALIAEAFSEYSSGWKMTPATLRRMNRAATSTASRPFSAESGDQTPSLRTV